MRLSQRQRLHWLARLLAAGNTARLSNNLIRLRRLYYLSILRRQDTSWAAYRKGADRATRSR